MEKKVKEDKGISKKIGQINKVKKKCWKKMNNVRKKEKEF